MASRADYLAAVNRPGAFQNVRWESDVPTAAAYRHRKVTKIVTATIRTGIRFENLAVNADRETGALPWGEWAVFPYVLTHKDQDYARLYVVDGTVKATYYIDGKAVERDSEKLAETVTPSTLKSSRSVGGTITPKLASITLL